MNTTRVSLLFWRADSVDYGSKRDVACWHFSDASGQRDDVGSSGQSRPRNCALPSPKMTLLGSQASSGHAYLVPDHYGSENASTESPNVVPNFP